jgi:hypothetical protein
MVAGPAPDGADFAALWPGHHGRPLGTAARSAQRGLLPGAVVLVVQMMFLVMREGVKNERFLAFLTQ